MSDEEIQKEVMREIMDELKTDFINDFAMIKQRLAVLEAQVTEINTFCSQFNNLDIQKHFPQSLTVGPTQPEISGIQCTKCNTNLYVGMTCNNADCPCGMFTI